MRDVCHRTKTNDYNLLLEVFVDLGTGIPRLDDHEVCDTVTIHVSVTVGILRIRHEVQAFTGQYQDVDVLEAGFPFHITRCTINIHLAGIHVEVLAIHLDVETTHLL